MKICDLHTHSVFSDGTFTPTEIIDSALKIGLSAVALCDHNTVDGLPEFIKAANGKDIEAIAGAEFSVSHNGKEYHLLGLYIPEKHFPEIQTGVRSVDIEKNKSNIDLIESLNDAGYEIDYETVKSSTPKGRVNRVHIAKALKEKGYVASVEEAFSTVLSVENGYYKEPKRLSLLEMIDFVRSIDAVPVLAHPFLKSDHDVLETLLPIAKERGLVGMECYYSLYDARTTEKSFRLADRFGLKYSGGSDFHGSSKPDIELGTGKGNLKIPYDWAVALRK